ncbi:hypothetical protein ACFQL4_07430 [Halosimplex aquaticum]
MGDTGWLDVLDRSHVAGVAVGVAILAVFGLGTIGVIDLPGTGPPEPPEAPGSGERAAGLSLSVTEEEYLAAFNERRSRAGLTPASRGEALQSMATYYNKGRVAAAYGNASDPSFETLERFDPSCRGSNQVFVDPRDTPFGAVGTANLTMFPNETAFATALLPAETVAVGESETRPTLWERDSVDAVGVDVHVAPEQHVYVTVVAC